MNSKWLFIVIHQYATLKKFKKQNKNQTLIFTIEYEKHAIEKIVSRKVLLSLTSKNSWHYINDVKIFLRLKTIFQQND